MLAPHTTRPRRLVPLGAVLVLLASGVPILSPTAPAQSTASVTVPDATADVVLGHPLSVVPAPTSAGLDITSTTVYGESGTAFLIRVEVANIPEEAKVPPLVSQGVHVVVCFKWNGDLYAVKLRYRAAEGGSLKNPHMGLVDGACNPEADVEVKPESAQSLAYQINLDTPRSRIMISVPRLTLAAVKGVDPPVPGETLTEFRTIMNDVARTRFDSAPNGGPSTETFTFASETANLGDLVAHVEANIPVITCSGRTDAPAYAVEAGGARGVPVVFANLGAATRQLDFEVATVDGLDWGARVVPTLKVPPTSEAGNTTVNVIVEMPAATNHKDCTILQVRGVDRDDPSVFAEALVIVPAVKPPGPNAKRLYFHDNTFARDTCSGPNSWLNVLETDPDDAGNLIYMKWCRDPAYLTLEDAAFRTQLDVNPNYDLVVNTSASGIDALANLVFLSEHAPTKARLTATVVTLQADGEVIGEGFAEATIGTTATPVPITLKIAFTRDFVATGDPSRVLASSAGLGLRIGFEPLPFDANVGATRVAGRVALVPQGTYLDLPIAGTIKRNANDPGQEGRLLSVKPLGDLPRFVAPGAMRLFNFTVLNEGPDPDAAVPTATFTGASGWTAQFFPAGPYALDPGERTTFQVGVLAPVDAEESERTTLDLRVTSQNDPTALSSVAILIIATREAGVPADEAPVIDGPKDDAGFLPAPAPVAALLAVGVAALGLRRRR